MRFVVPIPSSTRTIVSNFQWWHLMVEARSFCHLEIRILELSWLFNVFILSVSILLLSFYPMSSSIFLFVFLQYFYFYVYFCLLWSTFVCFYLLMFSVCLVCICVSLYVFIYVCLLLFAFICISLLMFVFV